MKSRLCATERQSSKREEEKKVEVAATALLLWAKFHWAHTSCFSSDINLPEITHQSWIFAFCFRERSQISPSARTQILQNKFRFNSLYCCFFDIIAESSWVNLKSLVRVFAHENNTSWHVEPWKDCSSSGEQPKMISVVFLRGNIFSKCVSRAHDSRSSIHATSKKFSLNVRLGSVGWTPTDRKS